MYLYTASLCTLHDHRELPNNPSLFHPSTRSSSRHKPFPSPHLNTWNYLPKLQEDILHLELGLQILLVIFMDFIERNVYEVDVGVSFNELHQVTYSQMCYLVPTQVQHGEVDFLEILHQELQLSVIQSAVIYRYFGEFALAQQDLSQLHDYILVELDVVHLHLALLALLNLVQDALHSFLVLVQIVLRLLLLG